MDTEDTTIQTEEETTVLAEASRPHLPVSTADLHRKVPRRYSIRQEVEDIWQELYDSDADFRAHLDGATNEEAVTGRLRFDNVMAAKMIQDNSSPDSQLRVPYHQGGPGLGKIWDALREVLKDWEISRKDQRARREVNGYQLSEG